MHPIFDGAKLKWSDPAVQQLYRLLGKIKKYKQPDMIELQYEMAGDDLPPLNLGNAPLMIWKEALENLHGNGYLRAFCELLKQEGKPPDLMRVLAQIFAKESITELKLINTSPLLDRRSLRAKLNELSKPESNARVVIVRGGKRTGKSHGRLLFFEVAKENGGTLISMQKSQVTVLKDVLDKLFGPFGGLPDKVCKHLEDFNKNIDTTDFAWLSEVGRTFLNTAMDKKANLWIAMDNLGKENDALLLPQEIKLFFDKLVLEMSSLTYLNHVRLMLMDYPEGETPPGWEQLIWLDDRIAQNDVEETHVKEVIDSWCLKNTKNPHEDDRRENARSIIARAEAEVAKATLEKPAYRIELIDKYLQEYLQGL